MVMVPNIYCNFIAPTIYEMFAIGFINNYWKVINMPLWNTDHGATCIPIDVFII